MNIREARSLDKYVKEIEEILIAVEEISPEKYKEYKRRMREFYRVSEGQSQENNVKFLFDIEIELSEYIKENGYRVLLEKQKNLMVDLLNNLEANVDVSNLDIYEKKFADMLSMYQKIIHSNRSTFDLEQRNTLGKEINEVRYKIIKYKFVKGIDVKLEKEISKEDALYIYRTLQKDIESMAIDPDNTRLEYIRHLINLHMNTDVKLNNISNKVYDKTIWKLVAFYETVKREEERSEDFDKRLTEILQESKVELPKDKIAEEKSYNKRNGFWARLFGKKKPLLIEAKGNGDPIEEKYMTDFDYFKSGMKGYIGQAPTTNQELEIPARITEEEARRITEQGISPIYIARYNEYIKELEEYKERDTEPESKEVQESRKLLDRIKSYSIPVKSGVETSLPFLKIILHKNGQATVKETEYYGDETGVIYNINLTEEQIEIIAFVKGRITNILQNLADPVKYENLRRLYDKSNELLSVYRKIVKENYEKFPKDRRSNKAINEDIKKSYRRNSSKLERLKGELIQIDQGDDALNSIDKYVADCINVSEPGSQIHSPYLYMKGRLSNIGSYFETLDKKNQAEKIVADYEEMKAKHEKERELYLQDKCKKAIQLRDMITGYRESEPDNKRDNIGKDNGRENIQTQIPKDTDDEVNI